MLLNSLRLKVPSPEVFARRTRQIPYRSECRISEDPHTIPELCPHTR